VQGPVTADVLDGVAHQIMDRISTIPGIKDATVRTPHFTAGMDIIVAGLRCPMPASAATTVGSTIATMVQGSVANPGAMAGRLTDVTVQLRAADISDTQL